jgi:hypothetical protein
MGMYTGLRVKCKIKSEYRPIILDLDLMKDDDNREGKYWLVLADKYPQYQFLREWGRFDRSNFIPFGAVCYLDYPWGDGHACYSNENGIWDFECSLKNYKSEIEFFLKNVLAEIAEEIYTCDYQYEESYNSTSYSLEDLKR